jgi:hypothetical protein
MPVSFKDIREAFEFVYASGGGENSISGSRSRWTSPANSYLTTSTTFGNFSADGAPTPDSRICWIKGARSINGTISRRKPRKER